MEYINPKLSLSRTRSIW